MKQTINIIAFFIVLAIPFALSSQTRKAIPVGRYEALSGVKNTRASKTNISTEEQLIEANSLFWNEVISHLPEQSKNNSFFISGKIEDYEMKLLTSKGMKPDSKINDQTKLVYSDDLKRDRDTLKNLKVKNSLVVLKDLRELKDVMITLQNFEVLLYQAENKSNYYLLKLKNN